MSNLEIIESFDTGTSKAEVNLVRFREGEFGVEVSDGTSNFTTFDVLNEQDGRMRARFVAQVFRAVSKKASAKIKARKA